MFSKYFKFYAYIFCIVWLLRQFYCINSWTIGLKNSLSLSKIIYNTSHNLKDILRFFDCRKSQIINLKTSLNFSQNHYFYHNMFQIFSEFFNDFSAVHLAQLMPLFRWQHWVLKLISRQTAWSRLIFLEFPLRFALRLKLQWDNEATARLIGKLNTNWQLNSPKL